MKRLVTHFDAFRIPIAASREAISPYKTFLGLLMTYIVFALMIAYLLIFIMTKDLWKDHSESNDVVVESFGSTTFTGRGNDNLRNLFSNTHDFADFQSSNSQDKSNNRDDTLKIGNKLKRNLTDVGWDTTIKVEKTLIR